MERYKRFLLVAASLTLVLALVTVLGTKEAHALVASMVQVVNNASNPVPNRDVDNPARQPYTLICTGGIADGESSHTCTALVPSGKRLVIENVNGKFFVPTGEHIDVKLQVTAAGGLAKESESTNLFANYPTVFQRSEPETHSDIYALNETVRLYADPSGKAYDVVISAERTGVGGAFVYMNITGYLVSL